MPPQCPICYETCCPCRCLYEQALESIDYEIVKLGKTIDSLKARRTRVEQAMLLRKSYAASKMIPD